MCVHGFSELLTHFEHMVLTYIHYLCYAGTVYGQGCYFARDASYSHRYSVADDQGIHYMYLVRVLVGEYTKGQPTMLEPPNKPNADKRYDSVVDNTSNPGIFVTFHDHDVYPEYLITYK